MHIGATLAALLATQLPPLPPTVVADPTPGVAALQVAEVSYKGEVFPLYPATMSERPAIPSPYTAADGTEVVVGFRETERIWTLIPVTVESGEPRNYKENQWGKGDQLRVDAADFSTLARSGLHSEAELDRTETITGKPLEEINADARPGGLSTIGFMAPDEDIISVLRGDNRYVAELGLTHPELAKPMLQLWNLVRAHDMEARRRRRPLPVVDGFSYNGRTITLIESESGKGWQDSIFNDGILGMFTIRIKRDLEPEEEAFLRHRYGQASDDQFEELTEALSTMRIGEMAAYYIQRYGFYEGHTGWRADPVSIAFIFGLRTIEEIEEAFEGDLYRTLTRHHTSGKQG